MSTKGWIIVGVLALLAIFSVSNYNGLVSREVAVNSAWAQVDNVLQRRSDLIPNLVSTVKGYAAHESQIFEQLAAARAQYSGARTTSDKMAAAGQMEGALARLMVVVENYPNLKANESFNRLMDELSGTENRIAVERKRYNEAVQNFNTGVLRFPQNIFARLFGFSPKTFFEAAPEARNVPKVDFGQAAGK